MASKGVKKDEDGGWLISRLTKDQISGTSQSIQPYSIFFPSPGYITVQKLQYLEYSYLYGGPIFALYLYDELGYPKLSGKGDLTTRS